MSTVWPDAVERVASYLRAAGVEARLEEFDEATATAEEAAEATGNQTAQIVKSLVFECDGQTVVAMVPGDRRADADGVARAVGAADARVARRAQVEAATGFAPGSVAPFPLPADVRVLMDRALLQHDVVWIGAGSPHHVAALAPTELAALSRARVVDGVSEAA